MLAITDTSNNVLPELEMLPNYNKVTGLIKAVHAARLASRLRFIVKEKLLFNLQCTRYKTTNTLFYNRVTLSLALLLLISQIQLLNVPCRSSACIACRPVYAYGMNHMLLSSDTSCTEPEHNNNHHGRHLTCTHTRGE